MRSDQRSEHVQIGQRIEDACRISQISPGGKSALAGVDVQQKGVSAAIMSEESPLPQDCLPRPLAAARYGFAAQVCQARYDHLAWEQNALAINTTAQAVEHFGRARVLEGYAYLFKKPEHGRLYLVELFVRENLNVKAVRRHASAP